MPRQAIAEMGGLIPMLNAQRKELSKNFQEIVPEINEKNFSEYASGILNNNDLYNEWAVNLINRIGLVVVRQRVWENPLAQLKKGMLDFGDTIEEVFTDIISEREYRSTMGKESAGEIYQSEVPDIYAVFHKENRKGMFPVTINRARLQRAFVTPRSLEEFISSIIGELIKSDNLAEFEYTKRLLTAYADKGLFKTVHIPEPTDKASVDLLLEKVKTYARNFTFLSRDYNAFNVMNAVDMSDQIVLISSAMDAKMDVQSLANAFNLDKIEFLPRKIVLDHMPVEGAHLILMSKELFMIYDTLFEIRELVNPLTLELKFFLHHHQILSTSRFENAVVFTTKEEQEPATITYTVSGTAKPGLTLGAVTEVKNVGEEVLEGIAVLYTVTGNNSPNTRCDNNGFLVIGSDETSTDITVKVKALYHDLETETPVTISQ